jgi:hypothetical protein
MVFGVHDGQARQVDPRFAGRVTDSPLRSYQQRGEVTGECTGERELKRFRIARIHERSRKRRQLPRVLDKAQEMSAGDHRESVASCGDVVNHCRWKAAAVRYAVNCRGEKCINAARASSGSGQTLPFHGTTSFST